MKAKTVALADVGEMLTINLSRLAHRLNSLQRSFQFDVVDPMPSASIGAPDVRDQWYEIAPVLRRIRSYPRFRDYDFLIGITQFKITNTTDRLAKNDRDYFSMSDMEKASVISVNQAVLIHKSPTKSAYQYIAFLAMCELLTNLTKTYLAHPMIHGCLFDECEDRSALIIGLEAARICPLCIHTIQAAGASQQVVRDVTTVLTWCSENTWRFAISASARSPFLALSIAVGGAILSLALPARLLWVRLPALILLFSIPFLVLLYHKKFCHKETKLNQT